MSKIRNDVLRPRYLRDFRCTAGACPDICCQRWNITVDRWFVERWRALPESSLKDKVMDCIVPPDGEQTDPTYGRIKLGEDGFCPFLTPDSLCSLQRELGADFLPQTCFMFPRVTTIVRGVYEQAGDLACPVLARQALFNPAGISFASTPLPAAQKRLLSLCNVLGLRANEAFGSAAEHLQDARLFSIEVLKHRDIGLNDRLILLGMFHRDVQDCLEQGRPEAVPEIIERRKAILRDPDLPRLFAELKSDIKIHLGLLLSLISRHREHDPKGGNGMLALFSDSIKGLGYSPGAAIEDMAQTFEVAIREFYEPYMRSREYVLENYLVNEFFRSCLPVECPEPAAAFDGYREFLARFALMRLLLIGAAGFHKGLTDDLLIRVVSTFGRTVNNNGRFIKMAHGFLQESGISTAGHLAILARI